MFRRILISAATAALLAGCVSSGYSYRADRGDYYYGQPQVEYRYHGGYDDGFGWPGYHGPYRGRYPGYGYPGYGRFSFGVGFGHPGFYGRYGSGWGYPYYHPYYDGRPHYRYRQPRPYTGYQPPANNVDRRDGSPWRNLDDVRRRQGDVRGPRPEPSAPRAEQRASRLDSDGSNMSRMIRQSRESARREDTSDLDQEP